PIRLKQIVEKIIHWQEQIQREGMQISEKRIKVTASEEYLRAFRYWFAPLWLLTIMSAFILLVIPTPNNLSASQQSSNTQTSSANISQATNNDPKMALKPYSEGVKLTKVKQFEKATAFYQQAVSSNPEFPEAWHELGYALLRLKKYDDAIM